MRRIKDVVESGYPGRVPPDSFPDVEIRTSSEARQTLDGLRPTSGNLAESETWRRIVGGRNRLNKQKQERVKARRKAILGWLMRNRMFYWCEPLDQYVVVDRIMVRHGDGAMISRALGVGKATICRDLSALQAIHPALFGQRHCAGDYEEYMAGWRYAHRSEMGNEQPHHNLRFPNNQNGAKARTTRRVTAELNRNTDPAKPAHSYDSDQPFGQFSGSTVSELPSTMKEFVAILDQKCPPTNVPELTEAHRWYIQCTISA